MALEIPTSEPASVRAGDTITWRRALEDYPPSAGWTLKYRLLGSAGKYDITATNDNNTHLVSVPIATSAAYAAGEYALISWVEDGTQRVTLPQSRITVLPDLAAATVSTDTRTHARKMLDAVDAALLSLSTGERLAVVNAEVQSRKLSYDFNGLMKLRNLFAAQVKEEEDAERVMSGRRPRNTINVRL